MSSANTTGYAIVQIHMTVLRIIPRYFLFFLSNFNILIEISNLSFNRPYKIM